MNNILSNIETTKYEIRKLQKLMYENEIKLIDYEKQLVDVKDIYPEITNRYSARLEGIYETAKYMLYHNQKIKLEIK